ncbi:uncharacterized protein LOC126668873 [Mercurialis annua]|uniref:uncharacterized protein LOC126668873 n=1 Tax=Mercurialis annua TaxID=3986 RepID=UPI0021606110|nr:uncharacterized protein LOC126668873 [Mercurialis annua]
MLQTEPSFSIYNDENEENNGADDEKLMKKITIGEKEFSFGKNGMGLIEEEDYQENMNVEKVEGLESLKVEGPVSPSMYLASGLGIDGVDFGRIGFDFNLPNFDENGDEEYYKRMVDEFPCHPLVLSNYAHLLQLKGDLEGAEEYYHRATMADPENGGILMKYAKLDWELHHDPDRALINFENAIQAAPQDSHVLAAYASFLWEIDGDGEEYRSHTQVEDFKTSAQLPPTADHGDDKSCNFEEYYKKRVEEHPTNSLVLRNYAQFLYQSKRDLQGSEEYYSRAMLADPDDGEIKSQYAKLVWEVHRDGDKASSYFEQAVQASPQNSHVLGAYARFLWETEEDEEDSAEAIHPENSVKL